MIDAAAPIIPKNAAEGAQYGCTSTVCNRGNKDIFFLLSLMSSWTTNSCLIKWLVGKDI